MITQPHWRFANGYDDTPAPADLAASLARDIQVPIWNPVSGSFIGPRTAVGGLLEFKAGTMGVSAFADFVCNGPRGAALSDAMESAADPGSIVERSAAGGVAVLALCLAAAERMTSEPGGWISIDMCDDPVGPLEVLYDFLLEIDPDRAERLRMGRGDWVAALARERVLARPGHMDRDGLSLACDGRAMWSPVDAVVFYASPDGVRALDGIGPARVLRDAALLARRASAAEGRPSSLGEMERAPLLLWVNDAARGYPLADQVFDAGQMLLGQDSVAAEMIEAALSADRATSLANLEESSRAASAASETKANNCTARRVPPAAAAECL